ncbi:uncharacterized protein LOC132648332 isoform X2 [Meriones unguiculatus]|uniref:uncharacterized protein LOC132648332 isoform X2 n=1 Tax=Meriones unguiculatus TaxID=10047 RepID=UPI00293E6918|nr:uncharacterized protein LOC132648332 isoform X2 [Meriones unguiculatus]
MESTRHSPSMPGRPWWRVVQEVSRAGAAQAARSVSAPGCLQHAQALGLDALPASSDLNRPVAYPRVPRGEGRAEGGAERWPRPSGKIDLWNAACELLCAAARGRAAPLQTWVRSSRLHLEHTPRLKFAQSHPWEQIGRPLFTSHQVLSVLRRVHFPPSPDLYFGAPVVTDTRFTDSRRRPACKVDSILVLTR